MSKRQVKYWELPPEKLRQHIIDNWASDEHLYLGDAIHHMYECTRPRDWVEVKDDALDLWQRMFKEEIEDESPIYSIIAGACAASAAGVWDTVAEAFGLNTRYVELALASWYERKINGEEAPPPLTWEEFMRLHEAEKAEREGKSELA